MGGNKRRSGWREVGKFRKNGSGIVLKMFALSYLFHLNDSFKQALQQIKTIYINTFRLSWEKINYEFDKCHLLGHSNVNVSSFVSTTYCYSAPGGVAVYNASPYVAQWSVAIPH